MEGRYSKYFIIIIILLSFFIFLSILPYFYIDYNPIPIPSDILESHQGLISLCGIVAAILIFWGTIRKQNKDSEREVNERIIRISKTLLKAIESQEKSFDASGHTISIEGNGIDLEIISTSAYDSIINSGLFTHFSTDIQDCLSNLSNYIKDRNELIKGFFDMLLSYTIDIDQLSLSITDKVEFYGASIRESDQKIQNSLKATKILIKKELSNVN